MAQMIRVYLILSLILFVIPLHAQDTEDKNKKETSITSQSSDVKNKNEKNAKEEIIEVSDEVFLFGDEAKKDTTEKDEDEDETSEDEEKDKDEDEKKEDEAKEEDKDEEDEKDKEDEEDEKKETPEEIKIESPKWKDESNVIKQQPQTVMPTKQPETTEPESDDDEIYGFDTVDMADPQGNWLYKRVWWERAEAKYEKIRATASKVMETRTGFFAKRADLDKTVLDPFYLSIGFGQGELLEVLNQLITQYKQKEEKRTAGIIHQEDEEILERLQGEKKEVELLKNDVQKIVLLDEAVENAILQLVELISRLRNYEQQAWKDFKDIARVLDDKKARELYYKVDGAWRNVQELQQYMENAYAAGFEKLINQVKQEVDRVKNMVDTLKAKGFDLKTKILQGDKVGVEEQEDIEEEQPGFVQRIIINPIYSIISTIGLGLKTVWDYIISIVTWPYRIIFGSAPEEEGVDEEMEEVDVEVAEPTEEIVEEQPVTPMQQQPSQPPSSPEAMQPMTRTANGNGVQPTPQDQTKPYTQESLTEESSPQDLQDKQEELGIEQPEEDSDQEGEIVDADYSESEFSNDQDSTEEEPVLDELAPMDDSQDSGE